MAVAVIQSHARYTQPRLDRALRVFRIPKRNALNNDLASGKLEKSLRNRRLGASASSPADAPFRANWSPDDDSDGEFDPANKRVKTVVRKRRLDASSNSDEEDKGTKGQPKDERHGAYTSFFSVKISAENKGGRRILANLGAAHGTAMGSYYDLTRHRDRQSQHSKHNKACNGNVLIDSCGGVIFAESVEPDLGMRVLRNGKITEKMRVIKKKEAGVEREKSVLQEIGTEGVMTRQHGLDEQENELSRKRIKVSDTKTALEAPIELTHHDEAIEIEDSDVDNDGPASTSSITDDEAVDEGHVHYVSTKFAHPLNFMSLPAEPCDFCKDWRFALLGWGRVNVEVITYASNPHEHNEMSGGYRANGKPATRMCVSCADARLKIMRCHDVNKHNVHCNLQPIPASASGPARQKRKQEYSARLLLHPPDSEYFVPQRQAPLDVCSLCPMPADWRCCSLQPRAESQRTQAATIGSYQPAGSSRDNAIILDDDEDDTSPSRTVTSISSQSSSSQTYRASASTPRTTPMSTTSLSSRPETQTGCGLVLCGGCACFLQYQCGGRLDPDLIKKHLGTSQVGQRADAQFLLKGEALDWAYGGGGRGM